MTRYLFERSYLVRICEAWEYEVPEDPEHLISDHFADFDTNLTGLGSKVGGDHAETVDERDLQIRVVSVVPEPDAKVIRFPSKEPT